MPIRPVIRVVRFNGCFVLCFISACRKVCCFAVCSLLFSNLFLVMSSFRRNLSRYIRDTLISSIRNIICHIPRIARTNITIQIVISSICTKGLPRIMCVRVIIYRFNTFFFKRRITRTRTINYIPCLIRMLANNSLERLFLMRNNILSTRRIRRSTMTNVVTICVKCSSPVLQTRTPDIILMYALVRMKSTVIFDIGRSSISTSN